MKFEKMLEHHMNARCIFCEGTGDYQGTDYYLMRRETDGCQPKYALVDIAYGTCAGCDWAMALEEEWNSSNGYGGAYPDHIYDPMISSVTQFVKWETKQEFLADLHMKLGGYDEESIKKNLLKVMQDER